MSYTPPLGDATTIKKGVVQLAGDLGGTATSPTVSGLTAKLDSSQKGAVNGVAPLDAAGFVGLAYAIPGSRFVCPWNTGTSHWQYKGIDLTARPSARTDIYFVYTGAPAATADPSFAITGDKREDI